MTINIKSVVAVLGFLAIELAGCGRAPSSLLRQGQLPVYDFPLYLTEGITGNVYQIQRDRTKTLIAEGLSDPRGVATDRFGAVYVAEYGAGRLIKIDPDSREVSVVADGLVEPSVVAVDSFGAAFVAQDGARNVIRASDGKVFAEFDALPTALAFGVNDQAIVGLYDQNRVMWGWGKGGDQTADVPSPINASIDGTGRVYVAQGGAGEGKVYRYHQHEPGEAKLVADNLLGPMGVAVDLVGNIFVVEQGAGRVVLISFDGKKYAWLTDVTDPQYLAFTQY